MGANDLPGASLEHADGPPGLISVFCYCHFEVARAPSFAIPRTTVVTLSSRTKTTSGSSASAADISRYRTGLASTCGHGCSALTSGHRYEAALTVDPARRGPPWEPSKRSTPLLLAFRILPSGHSGILWYDIRVVSDPFVPTMILAATSVMCHGFVLVGDILFVGKLGPRVLYTAASKVSCSTIRVSSGNHVFATCVIWSVGVYLRSRVR